MSPFLAAAIVIGATGVAVAAMLTVRRRAPEGSFFEDGDRAAGVFGVLATGFAVLLGLIVVIAFTSYDDSASGAEAEALTVSAAVRDRAVPPGGRPPAPRRRARLLRAIGRLHRMAGPGGRDAVGRAEPVVGGPLQDPEGRAAHDPSEQSAYDKWLDQTSEREQAANERRHGAEGVIPWQLWLVLFMTGRDHRRVRPLLRRQRRASRRAGGADGIGRRGDHRDAAADPRARQPVPGGPRRAPAGRDGANAPGDRGGAGGGRPDRPRSVRRARAGRGPNEPAHRDALDDPAGGGHPRHRLGGLSVHALAQRAGQVSDRRDGRPGRGDAAVRCGQHARGRSTWRSSSSGSTRAATGDKKLEAFYRRQFSPRLEPAFEAWIATDPFTTPRRAALALRRARVQDRGAAPVPAARGQGRPAPRTTPGRTSSAPTTTCSAWCSSPPRCSSRASARGSPP